MMNSNPIEINKSSLTSLKAEVLRKQQEINVNKLQERVVPPKNVSKTKKKTTPQTDVPEKDHEEEELLAKSKKMLENKARLYDTLTKRASNPTKEDKEITKRLLVQFDRKEPTNDNDTEFYEEDYESTQNPDDEWVEYTDYLGRTRKCLRKDLEYMKKKDRDLSERVDNKNRGVEKKQFIKDSGDELDKKVENENLTEENELLSSDMRRELLRREWEKQEEELLKKDNIHYQDVLFNEARSHGAGYYAFSKDEEERIKQQENLKKLREETNKQQKTMAELKRIREQQMAMRLKAARNRKRARMGLSPEADESEETNEMKTNEEDELKKRLQAEKEAEEKKKQQERNKMVRPWDIGKEILKQHYEHSQEEWVDKQRDQRPKEFAPPTYYANSSFKRPVVRESYEPEDKRLFFTSKKSKNNDATTSTTSNNSNRTTDSQKSESSNDPKDIEDSIMAGLRFLREQVEKQNN